MTLPESPTAVPSVTSPRTSVRIVPSLMLFAAVVGFVWLGTWMRLATDWSSNPQYHYGWAVPVLAIWLAWMRVPDRPNPSRVPRGAGWMGTGLALLAILLPIRLVEEANPEWRLILWGHVLVSTALTLHLVRGLGGWPWVRHFLFPVAFTLVAVPWPVPLERELIQGLMRGVAACTVEVVGWMGTPALQNGNVIRISSGLVGIDEACSGVRSLQTAIFVSCFLGELNRVGLGKRAALVILSLGMALLANVGRTVFLVQTAARDGMDAMHRVHDTAGTAALCATLGGLVLAAWILERGSRHPVGGRSTPDSPIPPTRPLPAAWLVAASAWLVLVELGNEAWYLSHESGLIQNPTWTVKWPAEREGYHELPITDTARWMLRYTEANAASWIDDEFIQWQVFLFRWAPGRNSAQLALGHTPDLCLQGAGYSLAEDLGMKTVVAAGIRLPVHQYVFTQDSRRLHVFYCHWENRTRRDGEDLTEQSTKASRFRAALAGRRHLGQQVMEIALEGPSSATEAFENLSRRLGGLIRSETLVTASIPAKQSRE